MGFLVLKDFGGLRILCLKEALSVRWAGLGLIMWTVPLSLRTNLSCSYLWDIKSTDLVCPEGGPPGDVWTEGAALCCQDTLHRGGDRGWEVY